MDGVELEPDGNELRAARMSTHRRLIRVTVVGLASVTVIVGALTTRSNAPSTRVAATVNVSTVIPAGVLTVIVGAANNAGDPGAATNGVAVLTHRQAAEALDADERVDTDQSVWYVQLHGHFTVEHSRGSSIGTVLLLTIDPATLLITDYGITNAAHDPAVLGEVHSLG